jgi:DNA ligase (NAD+)
MSASTEEFERVNEVGPAYLAIHPRVLRRRKEPRAHEKLRVAGLTFTAEKRKTSQLEGLSFVLTGSLPNLTREDAKTKIESAGARVPGSISKRTHYIVAGEDAGSKLDRARELGLDVFDEAALLRILSA